MTELKNAASLYAKLGFPVFPCEVRGKRPQTPNGFYDATTDQAKIDVWWTQNPDYNIGLRTGIERDGKFLVVIDVDPRNGGEDTLAALQNTHGKLPDTATGLTGGDGLHLFYWCPVEVHLAAKMGEGIDLKSRGGYVIAPPSIHPSGKRYEWEASGDLFDGVAINDLPGWVIDRFSKKPVPKNESIQVQEVANLEDALDDVLGYLDMIPADDRKVWIAVGMALHSTSHSEEMFHVYDQWSQKCPEKYDPVAVRKAWDSFKPEGGITVGTLMHLASLHPPIWARHWFNQAVQTPVEQKAANDGAPTTVPVQQDRGSWPQPIGFDEIDTPPIPAHLLPGVYGEFAAALAQETETPEGLAVMTVLGVIAAAANKRFVVALHGGYAEPVNIYTLIALPPGNRKSAVFNACTAPLVEWEKQRVAAAEQEIKRQISAAKSQEKFIESKRAQLGKEKDADKRRRMTQEIADLESEIIEPAALPQLFANDATPESLANSTHEQGGRFAVFSDEGGITETVSGLYSSGAANVDILLKGIDGGHLRVRRASRNFNLNPFLTIVLAVQPAIVQRMGEKKAFAGKGLMERFLWVIPRSTLGYRTHDTPAVSLGLRMAYATAVTRILDIPPLIEDNQERSRTLQLSPAAEERFREFRRTIEPQLRPDGRLAMCQGWGGKICGFALRLAGLLHIAEQGEQCLEISGLTMANALELADLLSHHALCAYGLMALDPATAEAKEVWRWIAGQADDIFQKRDLTYAMRHRMPVERIDKALKICFGNRSPCGDGW